MTNGISNLLVFGVNWIGDAVVSLGTLQAIRTVSPSTRITVLTSPRTAAIYRLSPAVDRVIERAGFLSGTDMARMFPVALCFPLSFRSAFELAMTGIRERVGFAYEFRSLFLSRALSYGDWKRGHRHQSTYYKTIAEAVFGPLPIEIPRLELSEDLIKRAEEFIAHVGFQGHPMVGVNPGAHYGSAKMWPESHYTDLLGRILSEYPNARILLFSGEKDRDVPMRIQKTLGPDRIASTDGKIELMLSVALFAKCRFVITNDSGMMHIGAAFGIRGAAFFGPTDPIATGPQSPSIRILSHPVRCAPCLLRECPIDHRCMELLKPADVWNDIRSDLSEAVER